MRLYLDLLISTKHKVQMRLVLQVSDHESKYWTNCNFNPMMAQEEKLREVIAIHPQGDINVSTKYHGKFGTEKDFSLKTTNVNKSLCHWEPWPSKMQNVVPIPPVNVEMFHWISDIFNLLVALEEKFRGSPESVDSSSGYHEYLYKMSWQSI